MLFVLDLGGYFYGLAFVDARRADCRLVGWPGHEGWRLRRAHGHRSWHTRRHCGRVAFRNDWPVAGTRHSWFHHCRLRRCRDPRLAYPVDQEGLALALGSAAADSSWPFSL